MSEVIKLKLVEAGEDLRLNADEILEEAKGNNFSSLAIIGQLDDGTIWVSGTANAGETMILLEHAKRFICFGEE